MKGTWLPIAAEHYQAGRFPAELFRELGRLGAIGASHVGRHGAPLRKRATAALMHAVEYGDGGLRCALTIQDSVVQALVRFGSDEQRARWLEPLCRGEADHARRRVQFGAPIGSRQLIQAQLADMARAVCMGEMLSLELARRWEEEPLSPRGIDLANHVARHLLDLEASFTYGGTHEIHALVLGKILTGESAF
jgi:alkylation response protein AidB-like acyl-CoA dehydrogenase